MSRANRSLWRISLPILAKICSKKLGLPDAVSAIGILTITPSEASIIACDIATKSGAVEIGFSIASPARWC